MCGCLARAPHWGPWPTPQACALTGNWTSDPLVCRPVLSPLSHNSQGLWNTFFFWFLIYFVYTISPCKICYVLWIIVQTAWKLLVKSCPRKLEPRPLGSYVSSTTHCMVLYTFLVKMEMRNFQVNIPPLRDHNISKNKNCLFLFRKIFNYIKAWQRIK